MKRHRFCMHCVPFIIACLSLLRRQDKYVVSMTGFVVLWLSHNSIISFLLVMGVWGWRLWGGGGGGGGKRSLLSGISGVQLLLECLGILIIILILRSNPFQTLHDKGCLPRTGEGELSRIWLEVCLKTFQTCILFQTKQSISPPYFRPSTDNDRIVSEDAFSIFYLKPDQILLVKG